MTDENDQDEIVPPGIGPSGELNLISRRRYPLSTVALVIALPLLVLLLIFVVRLLGG